MVFFVFDAEGNMMTKTKNQKPKRVTQIVKLKKRKDLDRLYFAIWTPIDGYCPYRALFLDVCEMFRNGDLGRHDGTSKYDFYIRRKKALLHCWDKLKWRPLGNRVVVDNFNNPYLNI